ncbi:NitT/TauT family transport system substrate-binding protein [Curtobacterium sp. PhB142]|uniref:ABC transporter substrate-binding protein n=1 Tax=unclassified Curtobacterium TaxID=257496 RepID=UPI0010D14242|nr:MULTISPECIES: ABC transporter substrate-binding protein [unclassified Curtobacterium]TCL87319.1 NitT/TauT family transport system substrate-binding protein [Curtobacterium sp. PhB142]TCM05332.1 NitT/TauT family transport system substrate-binding protein [Curtobacterium sp. PhB134]TCU81469.1 NitT/TauT family transport system substrate-binding protein [Curtobacterium sp. PhB191]TDW43342.1 NitT/TauT family transport system substrate-binding protein [Curtobacterium sp. PhB42]TDW54231.1 NitT/Tau
MQHSTMQHRTKAALAALATAVVALALTGCSTGSSAGTTSSEGSAISAERCKENKDAGKITYLSGYQYQSSASILEYIAADELGYFKDLCLDVTLKPGSGDTAQNTKLLASGQATVSAVAEQDLIQARANGIDITGISSYSNAGLDVLMTNKDITKLPQLDGQVVGHKGYVPASVRAMMEKAGVEWDSLTLVKEGYDPSVLPRKQNGLEALTGFVSNEPNLLKAAGDDVTVWQPVDYDIPSSIGAMAVNPAFAKAHPTAVEDVLRAALHAYDFCSASEAKTKQCVGYAAKLSGATYDTAQNTKIWTTETKVIADNPTPDQPLGGIDPENVTKLVDMLHQFDIVKSSVTADDAKRWFTNEYIDAITKDGETVWPAP